MDGRWLFGCVDDSGVLRVPCKNRRGRTNTPIGRKCYHRRAGVTEKNKKRAK
jgi:hypothetical protein